MGADHRIASLEVLEISQTRRQLLPQVASRTTLNIAFNRWPCDNVETDDVRRGVISNAAIPF